MISRIFNYRIHLWIGMSVHGKSLSKYSRIPPSSAAGHFTLNNVLYVLRVRPIASFYGWHGIALGIGVNSATPIKGRNLAWELWRRWRGISILFKRSFQKWRRYLGRMDSEERSQRHWWTSFYKILNITPMDSAVSPCGFILVERTCFYKMATTSSSKLMTCLRC